MKSLGVRDSCLILTTPDEATRYSFRPFKLGL